VEPSFGTDYYTLPANTTWQIDWGDGNTESQTTSIPTLSHDYRTGDGSYNFSAQATLADGTPIYDSGFVPVTVAPRAPTDFTATVIDTGANSTAYVLLGWAEDSNLIDSFDLYYLPDTETPSFAGGLRMSANSTFGAGVADPEAEGYVLCASNISYTARSYSLTNLLIGGDYSLLLVAKNAGGASRATAAASLAVATSGTLAPQSYGAEAYVPIGFPINFYGLYDDYIFVNENGTVSLRGNNQDWPNQPLVNSTWPVFAPFQAQVDTSEVPNFPSGGTVSYGPADDLADPVDNQYHQAFAVHWTAVDRLARESSDHQQSSDTFALYLFNRKDRAPGDFDIAFVYGDLGWDTADGFVFASPDQVCYARAGFSNTSHRAETYFEPAASGTSGGIINWVNTLPIFGTRHTYSRAIINASAHLQVEDLSLGGATFTDTNKGVLGVVADKDGNASFAIRMIDAKGPGTFSYSVYDGSDNLIAGPNALAATDMVNFTTSQPGMHTIVLKNSFDPTFSASVRYYLAYMKILWNEPEDSTVSNIGYSNTGYGVGYHDNVSKK
jgi:hypothetical protein